MWVISKKRLREFWAQHPDSQVPLTRWYAIARRADWTCFADVRGDFPHADAVKDYVVFNIAGNKYRLVTSIRYAKHKVFIVLVTTHRDYDAWTKDQRSG